MAHRRTPVCVTMVDGSTPPSPRGPCCKDLGQGWAVISSSDAVWARSPLVSFVDDGYRVVMMDLSAPSGQQPRLLTGLGAAVWRALDIPVSARDLTVIVEGAIEPSCVSWVDTTRFLEVLEAEGLVHRPQME